jgi:hypothetical protein
MVMTEEAKRVVRESAFLVLVTVNPDGSPHPIVAGKGEVDGDTVVFGVYKMERTQRNIASNAAAQVLGAVTAGGPLGFRLYGNAAIGEVDGNRKIVFTVSAMDELL